MDKFNLLYDSCVKAGYACAEQSFNNVFESWKKSRDLSIEASSIEELIGKYGAWIGFPTADDVINNFADQSGEYLYGDNQADIIYIDDAIFPEFNGRNHWEVLDKCFGDISVKIVKKAFQESLDRFLASIYPKSEIHTSQKLICINEKIPLDVDVDITLNDIEELGIDSFGDGIEEVLSEILIKYVEPESLQKVCYPKGIIDGDELGNEIVDSALVFLNYETNGKLFIRRDGYVDEPITNDWILNWVSEYYQDSSTYCPLTGVAIIRCVTEFLNKGRWHLDLDKYNEPFLWFGLDEDGPIEIWSLPFDSDIEYTSWKTIWFPAFWDLDWNAILNDTGEIYITWMFCELGMDEPTEERDRARLSCPIELTEEDSLETIRRKIKILVDREKYRLKKITVF